MTLKIKNTLSKKKEIFIPLEKNEVKIYQCGPTLYWNQHIGNLRSVVLADFINRSLLYLGYQVNFVRNYTDVGHLSGDNQGDADSGQDRMEKAVERENIKISKIVEKYQKAYEQDISDLNTLPPQKTPKATEYIKEQIQMIENLLEKRFAYQTDLAIYFDTAKTKDYGKLSGQNISENICGAGTGNVTDKQKRNSTDFALWFFKKHTHQNALQTWTSPFQTSNLENGEGFPGWHLECSVMAKSLLGDTLDIKIGGIEHIPIHHTNEIAQSESANQKQYVKYWMHNEHLLVNDKKMAKSEGTSFLLSDIIGKGYSPIDLRYFFLQAHYRSKQNFTWEALKASEVAAEKLNNKISSYPDGGKVSIKFKKNFIEKIEDDFNTPEALAVVWKMLKSDISDTDKKATFLDFNKVLGLNFKTKKINKIPKEILSLAKNRQKAREEKDWKLSDKIRDKILEKGYEIKDEKEGQVVIKK